MKHGSTDTWINESMEQWVNDSETVKHWTSDSDSISQLISVLRGQFKEAASRCIRSFVFNALMPQCITCWVKQYSMNQWTSEAIDHKRCVFWSIQQRSRMNESIEHGFIKHGAIYSEALKQSAIISESQNLRTNCSKNQRTNVSDTTTQWNHELVRHEQFITTTMEQRIKETLIR